MPGYKQENADEEMDVSSEKQILDWDKKKGESNNYKTEKSRGKREKRLESSGRPKKYDIRKRALRKRKRKDALR